MFLRNSLNGFMGGFVWVLLNIFFIQPTRFTAPLAVLELALVVGLLHGLVYAGIHLFTKPRMLTIFFSSMIFLLGTSLILEEVWIYGLPALRALEVLVITLELSLMAVCTWAFTKINKESN